MVCYEVLVEAATPAVAEEFVAWMRAEHGPAMLAIPGCLAYKVLRRSETLVACEYDYADQAALDHYLEHGAAALRAQGTARFTGRIQIDRRVVPIAAIARRNP